MLSVNTVSCGWRRQRPVDRLCWVDWPGRNSQLCVYHFRARPHRRPFG